jgi:sporulation protein YunB
MGMKARNRKRHFKTWFALLLLILVAVGYMLIDEAIRPTILSLSEARLRAIAVKSMNEAVRETVGSGVSYTDLISIQKDDEGNITLVSANAVLMNNLAANTAIAAQEKILNIGEQGIKIPIGTIMGGQLLSGRGPAVIVRVEPVGSVTTDFMTEFEDAGINQTRHKIYLILNATVRILIGNTSQTVEISSQVLISETIIIGDVPQSFVEVDNTDDLLNLLPDSMIE